MSLNCHFFSLIFASLQQCFYFISVSYLFVFDFPSVFYLFLLPLSILFTFFRVFQIFLLSFGTFFTSPQSFFCSIFHFFSWFSFYFPQRVLLSKLPSTFFVSFLLPFNIFFHAFWTLFFFESRTIRIFFNLCF